MITKKSKGIVSSAMNIALGVVLLVAIILPFATMAREANASVTTLGLSATAWTAIVLVIVVLFVFSLIRHKK